MVYSFTAIIDCQVVPAGAGTWKMDKNKFWQPAKVDGWAMVIFAQERFWPPDKVTEVKEAFVSACTLAGAFSDIGFGCMRHPH